MPRGLMLAGLGVALVMVWGLGGFAQAEVWAAAAQREAQEAMAATVRALRGGQPGAVWGLLVLAFGYGVAHAAGPGHGKVLIGSYGVARRVPMRRLAAIALASSLAQAGVAVALVYAAVAVLGWTRDRVLGVAADVMAPVGHLLIAGLGVWLIWRGIRGLQQQAEPLGHGVDHSHSHSHSHSQSHSHSHVHVEGEPYRQLHDTERKEPVSNTHTAHDASCTHAHGPTLDQVSSLTGWRDVAALIAGIAVRPCSGALFLLILTWQLGIGAAGVAGAFAMGLGTAMVTIGVAAVAVWARDGAFASPVRRPHCPRSASGRDVGRGGDPDPRPQPCGCCRVAPH